MVFLILSFQVITESDTQQTGVGICSLGTVNVFKPEVLCWCGGLTCCEMPTPLLTDSAPQWSPPSGSLCCCFLLGFLLLCLLCLWPFLCLPTNLGPLFKKRRAAWKSVHWSKPLLCLSHNWRGCSSLHRVLSLWEELISLQIFSLPGHQSQRFAGTYSGLLYSSLLLHTSLTFNLPVLAPLCG